MQSFNKAFKYLVLYFSGFIITVGFLITWIILLNNTTGTEPADIWLLSVMFLILFSAELIFIILYLVTPRIVLSYREHEVVVFKTKHKHEIFPLQEIASFASTKRNLYLVTKANRMVTIRFLGDVKGTETILRTTLNEYITTYSDAYFNG